MESTSCEGHLRHHLKLFIPSIDLDRSSCISLKRQIYLEIARAIRSGAVNSGARLPSTRVMSRMLRVSRNTVLAAYDELAADDLIRGERGSGMRVNGYARLPSGNLFGLRNVVRDANYPARILVFHDSEGNPLYLNFGGSADYAEIFRNSR